MGPGSGGSAATGVGTAVAIAGVALESASRTGSVGGAGMFGAAGAAVAAKVLGW